MEDLGEFGLLILQNCCFINEVLHMQLANSMTDTRKSVWQ